MEKILKFIKNQENNKITGPFDAAIDLALNIERKDYPCYIGGFKIASGHDFSAHSPIDKDIIFGSFQEPEEGFSDRVVTVAEKAFKIWSKTNTSMKKIILSRIYKEIKKQRHKLSAVVSLSVGMTRTEALKDVDLLLDIIKKTWNDIELHDGKPIGVWAILSSFNSPLAAPIGYACVAIATGNTVVLAQSAKAPLPAYMAYDIIVNSGLPDGVLNLFADGTTDGKSIMTLANNPNLSGIVATGSGKIMEDLMFLQMNDSLRFINEIKGMNPIFVYKPSDMIEAAKIIINSAFSFTGQHITSCSKVVILENESKQLIDAIKKEIHKIKITDPTLPDAFCGPIISEEKMKEFFSTTDNIKQYIISGGERIINRLTENGFYVMPAIAVGLGKEHILNNIDSALPILSIQTVQSVDESIEVINCTECGLCVGIISNDAKVVKQFTSNVNVDNVVINKPTTTIGAASKATTSNFINC